MKQIFNFILLALLSLLVLQFSGCKKTPTLALDNELDPEAESFKPKKPFAFQSKITINTASLLWQQDKKDLDYIDGYVIHKSEVDSTETVLIATLSVNENIFRQNQYRFIDPDKYNGIYAFYSIRSFYIQRDNTVYSEPLSLTINTAGFQIDLIIEPFKQQPTLDFNWYAPYIYTGAEVLLYSKELNTKEAILFETLPISSQHTSITFDVNQYSDIEYFYRVTFNNIQSNLKIIDSYINAPRIHFLETSEFHEDEIRLDVGYSQDTSFVKPVIESFQIRISESKKPHWDYATDPDTTFVKALSGDFSPPSEEVLINSLDRSKYYLTELFGVRGIYQTEIAIGTLYFDSTFNQWRLNTYPW